VDYCDDDEEREEEPQEIQTVGADPPGPCCICGKPDRGYACFRCGRPICINAEDYWSDSTCGGWILDTHHPGHPEDNEFYCNVCLHAGLVPDEGVTAAGMIFKYTDHKTLTITIDGQERELDTQETRDLAAYLHDQCGELFLGQEVNEGSG
jgi:hypothetical protein